MTTPERTVEEIEKEIEYEQMQFDIASEYPSYTDQYFSALEKQRQKLSGMKQKLSELKKTYL